MSTILYKHIIFGPIKSRRLGNSLGVNLLPKFGKWCSFDCIYCECGWNKDGRDDTTLPAAEDVYNALEYRLKELKEEGTSIDTVTFSGNGEPTLHPDFDKIIDFTIALRDKYCSGAVVSVLTNASQIGKESVRKALMKVDNPILKIDSAIEEMAYAIDRPNKEYSLQRTIDNMKLFNGNFILQTMFLKGTVKGKTIDCTNPEHCSRWIKLVEELSPREVMMYTLDRETPAQGLQKVSADQMRKIAEPLLKKGFKIQIRG